MTTILLIEDVGFIYRLLGSQGLIILDRFSYILFKNKEIKNSLIDLASVIK